MMRQELALDVRTNAESSFPRGLIVPWAVTTGWKIVFFFSKVSGIGVAHCQERTLDHELRRRRRFPHFRLLSLVVRLKVPEKKRRIFAFGWRPAPCWMLQTARAIGVPMRFVKALRSVVSLRSHD